MFAWKLLPDEEDDEDDDDDDDDDDIIRAYKSVAANR